DSAIVNVAGPAMQRDLRLSGPALQLAVYSYLLVYAVAASFSGVLATVNQLAIVTGVAGAGTHYLSAPVPLVLLALAAALAVTGAALARRALTKPASLAAAR